MVETIDIRIEENGSKGLYFFHIEDAEKLGEFTFSRSSDNLAIVDHIGVPGALRSKCVGAAPDVRVVTNAREKGVQIIPLGQFFRAQAKRQADWLDVLQGHKS